MDVYIESLDIVSIVRQKHRQGSVHSCLTGAIVVKGDVMNGCAK